jgi:hypothetical protein
MMRSLRTAPRNPLLNEEVNASLVAVSCVDFSLASTTQPANFKRVFRVPVTTRVRNRQPRGFILLHGLKLESHRSTAPSGVRRSTLGLSQSALNETRSLAISSSDPPNLYPPFWLTMAGFQPVCRTEQRELNRWGFCP